MFIALFTIAPNWKLIPVPNQQVNGNKMFHSHPMRDYAAFKGRTATRSVLSERRQTQTGISCRFPLDGVQKQAERVCGDGG